MLTFGLQISLKYANTELKRPSTIVDLAWRKNLLQRDTPQWTAR